MSIDMSPKAIERRLNDLNEVWLLCVTLSKARPTDAKTPPRSKKPAGERPAANPIRNDRERS